MADPFDLTGKITLITGAAMGLGRAFALALARRGATVLCADKDLAGARETAGMLPVAGRSLEVDVTDPESVAAMARAAGTIDVLINNAGITTPPARVHELAIADWHRVVATNLNGTFLCTRAMIPALLERGGGSIVNLSSVLGLGGYYPGFSATPVSYGASKAGIEGFTRQVALEYARDGIRVNAIAPGWHDGTQLGHERRASATAKENERFAATIEAEIPMGHFGAPEDLDGLIVYLAADASRYVTGQIFAHDGGWSAR